MDTVAMYLKVNTLTLMMLKSLRLYIQKLYGLLQEM